MTELSAWMLIAAVLYLFPSFVAIFRGHRNGNAIAVLNLLLGWTFVGWVVALVWASTANTKGKAQ